MRRMIGGLCLGMVTLFALPAHATEVAVVDWREALMNTNAAQQSRTQLENRIGSQQQQAQSLGQELQQLQQRLQQDGDVMSDSERQQVQQELQQKGQQFQQLRAQIQQAQQRAEQQLLEESRPKLEQAIDQVVQRHGVEVVVDGEAAIHVDDGLDLTDEVTQILDSLN
ncbi:OmpH family outer membrane protein [Aidingimonas lacisalsi]|uniref:OmpH family outer membrane protein n=1 Tax=Aidingimonas lacisalsi TaxID=2604086 RepID=UPI0011D2107E|nr:OmpH family outer membrane protein [Aidingimonas lacisalsi]